MLLPRTEPVFDGLRTSFLRFDGLLAELRNDRHSGFVAIEFPGYTGTILVDGGEAVAATETLDGAESHGAAALKGIVTRACEPGGVVGVFRLANAFVQVAATVGTGAPLYKDLSSTFTSLDRLMAKLRDGGFSGYIEAVFAEPAASGLVFLRGGAVGVAVFEENGEVLTGEDAVDRIIGESAEREATYHVFHTGAGEKAEGIPVPAAPGAPPSRQAEPVASQVTVISGPLAVWSEILRRSEEVVDGLSQKGTFGTALHEALTERSNVFPYLDPAKSEFVFEDGHASFNGDLPETLPDALSNCLHDVIARLAFRLKRSDIESRIRAELSDIRSRHAAVVQGFPASARTLVS